jgi:hypothetical protein
MTTRERVARYIVVNTDTNRIVATTAGTHSMMLRICDRLDQRHGRGRSPFIYDDATAGAAYLPQQGPNLALSVR